MIIVIRLSNSGLTLTRHWNMIEKFKCCRIVFRNRKFQTSGSFINDNIWERNSVRHSKIYSSVPLARFTSEFNGGTTNILNDSRHYRTTWKRSFGTLKIVKNLSEIDNGPKSSHQRGYIVNRKNDTVKTFSFDNVFDESCCKKAKKNFYCNIALWLKRFNKFIVKKKFNVFIMLSIIF